MNKGYGVIVKVTPPGKTEPTTAPVVVVARDERDAEVAAEKAVGPNARAETLRELTDEEMLEHGLYAEAHGTVRALTTAFMRDRLTG